MEHAGQSSWYLVATEDGGSPETSLPVYSSRE